MKIQTPQGSERKIIISLLFLMLFSSIPLTGLAQSIPNTSKPVVNLTWEDKAISISRDNEKEINYVISDQYNEADCPNKEKLIGLCSSIFMRIEDDDPESPYVYQYQRKIIEASCADMEKDSEAEISRKVNIMWNKYENDLLTCDFINFNVRNGNILKLAVSRRLESLIQDAAQVWKVNLNKIDPADQGTVLDYVQYQINTYKNTDNEATLQQYYTVLRNAGAKHTRELKK